MAAKDPGLARSVGVTLAGTAFPPLAALATAPILAQGLGVEARGQVAAAQAVALLAVSLATFGVPDAVTHYVARGLRRDRRVDRWLWTFVLATGVAAVAIIFALAPVLGGNDDVTIGAIRLAAGSVPPALILGIVRARASGDQRWSQVAAERILGSSARMLGAVILFASGELTVMTGTALVAFSPLVGICPYLIKRRNRPDAGQDAAYGVREIAGYSGRVWIGAVSGILLMRIDQALLVPVAGAVALGLYAVAVTISELPLVINAAIRDVLFSRQSHEYHPDTVTRAARVSAIACAIVGVILAGCVPWAIPVLFGSDFADAVPLTWILLLAVVVGTPGSIAGAGLSAIGRPGLRSVSLTAAAMVNIVALVMLAQPLGAFGAALATLIGNLVSSNLNIYFLNRFGRTSWAAMYMAKRADFVYFTLVGRRLLAPLTRVKS